MDDVEFVMKLQASAAGAVPDVFLDAAAHEVVGEDEFPPSWKWDGGVGFHGDEAVLGVPSVGEAVIGYQIAVEVMGNYFWGGWKEFSSVAAGGAVGVGGGDAEGNVNGASACG